MRSHLFIPLLALILTTAGCHILPSAKVDPTRFFVLTSPELKPTQTPPSSSGLRLGITKLEIPGYLQNRSIVVKQNTNEVSIQDLNRWAEPLETALGRVIKSGLIQNPRISSVNFAPFPIDMSRDYDVTITLNTCEGFINTSDKTSAQFSASVEITTPSPESKIIAKYNYIAQSLDWDGTDYVKLAEELSSDALALGTDIPNHLP